MKKMLIAVAVVLIASAAVAKPEHKGHHKGHQFNADKHIEFVIKRFDTDKNGELSKAEIKKMFEARAEFIKKMKEHHANKAKACQKGKPEAKKECPKKKKSKKEKKETINKG